MSLRIGSLRISSLPIASLTFALLGLVACEPPPHKLIVDIALANSDAGVPFGTQNGSLVYVQPGEIAGKPYLWLTANMGESAANAVPLEFGSGSMSTQLTAHFETSPKYHDGAVELALFISLTSGSNSGPQAGDLAAFDNSDQPQGEPQPTGTTVRMHLSGADAAVTLDNRYFIRF